MGTDMTDFDVENAAVQEARKQAILEHNQRRLEAGETPTITTSTPDEVVVRDAETGAETSLPISDIAAAPILPADLVYDDDLVDVVRDSDLAALATDAELSTALALKADAAATTTALAAKADAAATATALSAKADAAATTSALASKADAATVNTALAAKADSSTVSTLQTQVNALPTSDTNTTFKGVGTTLTGSYTPVLADANKVFQTAGFQFTIPNNTTVAFPIGTALVLVNTSTTAASSIIGLGSGVTLNNAVLSSGSPIVPERGGTATLVKVATDTWNVYYSYGSRRTEYGPVYEKVTLLGSSGTVSLDFDSGNSFRLNPTAAVTNLTAQGGPSNSTSYGLRAELLITMPGTAWAITWAPRYKFHGGSAPTINANTKWLIRMWTNDPNSDIYCDALGPFT